MLPTGKKIDSGMPVLKILKKTIQKIASVLYLDTW
jgi:hypothetical protein